MVELPQNVRVTCADLDLILKSCKYQTQLFVGLVKLKFF